MKTEAGRTFGWGRRGRQQPERHIWAGPMGSRAAGLLRPGSRLSFRAPRIEHRAFRSSYLASSLSLSLPRCRALPLPTLDSHSAFPRRSPEGLRSTAVRTHGRSIVLQCKSEPYRYSMSTELHFSTVPPRSAAPPPAPPRTGHGPRRRPDTPRGRASEPPPAGAAAPSPETGRGPDTLSLISIYLTYRCASDVRSAPCPASRQSTRDLCDQLFTNYSSNIATPQYLDAM